MYVWVDWLFKYFYSNVAQKNNSISNEKLFDTINGSEIILICQSLVIEYYPE